MVENLYALKNTCLPDRQAEGVIVSPIVDWHFFKYQSAIDIPKILALKC